MAPPHPLIPLSSETLMLQNYSLKAWKIPRKRGRNLIFLLFSQRKRIQQDFFPSLLSFKPCWVQICKLHPRGAEIFQRDFSNYSGALFLKTPRFFYPQNCSFPSLQADTTTTSRVGKTGKLTRKKEKRKTNPPPGSHQILGIPKFPVPGGRSGSFRSCGGIPAGFSSRNCTTPHPTQLWPHGSWRKMGFSCQLPQQVQVCEVLPVNSSSGSTKLFLGAPKIHSKLEVGIFRNQFFKEILKNSPKNPKKESKPPKHSD